jgi:two-component system phosphate regulon response regulator PhoB
MEAHILIVDDEEPQVEMLKYNLEKEGFKVSHADNGEEGVLTALEQEPDLIVLDWMMPKMSGIEACRQLRADKVTKDIPIVMLTARGEEVDRIKGLDTGADDYMVKPFSPSEMIARIRAVLRRSRPVLAGAILDYEGIVIDPGTHKVSRDGNAIRLGPTEYKLLTTLMERPAKVLSRERLLDLVWGRDIDVELRTVDVHIRRLRKELNKNGGEDLIRTVRGAGYAIDREK